MDELPRRTDNLTHRAIRPNVWMLTNHEPNEGTMSYLEQYLENQSKLTSLRWHLHYIKGVLEAEKTNPSPQVTIDLIQERIEEAFKQWDGK